VETTPELKLDYPCHWEYKLILSSEHCVSVPIKDVLDTREHDLKPSQNSTKGNYISYTLKVLVHNDDDRTTLFRTLKSHKHIKFVL
jgi:uncharacterized protein